MNSWLTVRIRSSTALASHHCLLLPPQYIGTSVWEVLGACIWAQSWEPLLLFAPRLLTKHLPAYSTSASYKQHFNLGTQTSFLQNRSLKSMSLCYIATLFMVTQVHSSVPGRSRQSINTLAVSFNNRWTGRTSADIQQCFRQNTLK